MRSFLFFVYFLLLFSIHALAQPGTLDQSFGNGGIVVTDFDGVSDYAFDAAFQSDGRIILAGRANATFALARYNKNGIPDLSFGVNGRIITEIDTNFLHGSYSIVIQTDDKILLGGFSFNSNICIIRYKKDGDIDSTFGVNGIINDGSGNIAGLCIQPDGKILAAGYNGPTLILNRYLTNGLIDSSFGKNGKIAANYKYRSFGKSLVVQPDGKILLGAQIDSIGGGYSYPSISVLRYQPNGNLDSSFGFNGRATIYTGSFDYEPSITLLPDGKILASGLGGINGNRDFCLAKFTENGIRDSAFDENGLVLANINDTANRSDYATCIAVQKDGMIIQAGRTFTTSSSDFAIVRYKSNAVIDSSFGNSGRIITDFYGKTDYPYRVLIGQDQKIIVAGWTVKDIYADFVMVRYNNEEILPITLSYFTATKKQNSILLNWQTASESNNSYFAIERSNSNSNFKELGKVNSKGNSTQTQEYSFEDNLPLNGVNYYRLKQVNKDGSSTISKTVLVDFSKAAIIKIYPNPVKNVITIEGLTGKKTTISIIDINGRVLTSTSTNDPTYTWNIKALPQGTYYLRTEADKKVNTVKFIKE